MRTFKKLRAKAKDYGLPNQSKLKKNELIEAIAKVWEMELTRRCQRVQKTERFSANRDDVDNLHKEGRDGTDQ